MVWITRINYDQYHLKLQLLSKSLRKDQWLESKLKSFITIIMVIKVIEKITASYYDDEIGIMIKSVI